MYLYFSPGFPFQLLKIGFSLELEVSELELLF